MDNGWFCLHQMWNIIARLRGKNGCPWDRQQTPDSVKNYIIEEAHEAVAAIRRGDKKEIVEELGDLIFMTLFMVFLFDEAGEFTLNDVCHFACEKMIRRHPHVFGTVHVNSADEVKENWTKIKKKEGKRQDPSAVPATLPALMRAYRMLGRGFDVGIDYLKNPDVLVSEISRTVFKIREFPEDRMELLGRALLLLVLLGKIYGLQAEEALHKALDG